MIVFVLFIFVVIVSIGLYMHGYEQGFIDGRLDEKWRTRDERKTRNIKDIS